MSSCSVLWGSRRTSSHTGGQPCMGPVSDAGLARLLPYVGGTVPPVCMIMTMFPRICPSDLLLLLMDLRMVTGMCNKLRTECQLRAGVTTACCPCPTASFCSFPTTDARLQTYVTNIDLASGGPSSSLQLARTLSPPLPAHRTVPRPTSPA